MIPKCGSSIHLIAKVVQNLESNQHPTLVYFAPRNLYSTLRRSSMASIPNHETESLNMSTLLVCSLSQQPKIDQLIEMQLRA